MQTDCMKRCVCLPLSGLRKHSCSGISSDASIIFSWLTTWRKSSSHTGSVVVLPDKLTLLPNVNIGSAKNTFTGSIFPILYCVGWSVCVIACFVFCTLQAQSVWRKLRENDRCWSKSALHGHVPHADRRQHHEVTEGTVSAVVLFYLRILCVSLSLFSKVSFLMSKIWNAT